MKQFLKNTGVALFIFSLAFILSAVTSCQSIKNSMPVTPTWYQTDYQDFDLIFVDRKGRIENILNENATTLGSLVNKKVVIVKDGKIWRVAETYEETLNLEETTEENAQVIKVDLDKIKPYRRTQH